MLKKKQQVRVFENQLGHNAIRSDESSGSLKHNLHFFTAKIDIISQPVDRLPVICFFSSAFCWSKGLLLMKGSLLMMVFTLVSRVAVRNNMVLVKLFCKVSF